MMNKIGSTAFVLTMVLLLLPGPAPAQQSGAGASSLEEVVVTAQRREQNLQDVPVAVTAFTARTLREADLHGLEELATRVPSLTFSPFSPGQSIISLRGVSSNDDGAATDNSVAVFIDDVYVGGIAAVDVELFDLASVEVLRGPQGTLFGKNAIGGVINIRSAQPNTEEVGGKVEVTVGDYDQLDFRALVSGPLSESWAGKLVYTQRQNDGYVFNPLLDRRQQDEDVQSLRGQLLYHGDDLEVLLSLEAFNQETEDIGRVPVTNNAVPGIVESYLALGGDRHTVFGPSQGFVDRDGYTASGRVSKQFANGSLLSITALRDFGSSWDMDSVGVPFGPPGANLSVIDDIDEEIEAVSQEFRWVSNLDGSVNYVAGLFFLNEQTHRVENFRLGSGIGFVSTLPAIAIDTSDQDNTTRSYAGFGQVTWNLNERATLNVGARLTFEEKEIDNISTAGGFGIINDNFIASADDDWTNFSPKASLDYRATDEVLLYASVARGFKSGGFPAAPARAEDFVSIEPEFATSYELGVKADLLNNRLRFNATAYYSDVTDLQIQRFGRSLGETDPDAFGVFQTLNAGDAEVTGLEAELTWLLGDRLTFTGSVSLLDSKFVDTVLGDAAGNPVDISGQDLTRAPDTKYALALDYVHPIASGELRFRLDHRYTAFNRQDIFSDLVVQPAFRVSDARAAWLSASGAWEVALWSKNIGDEEYIAHAYIVGPGVIAVFGDPRTYGLTVTRSF